jgi:ATP-dependent DNA helicase RecQ
MARQRSKQKQIQDIGQKTFGYDNLRPGQQQVIEAVVEGHDKPRPYRTALQGTR